MRLLFTGLGGSPAPVLATVALSRGEVVLRRDRQAPGFEPGGACRRQQPHAVAHLGLLDVAGSRQLTGLAAAAALPFHFTSTAMVFDHEPDGPHHPADCRVARDDYGPMKIASEDAVLTECPSASVVRLGWQVGDAATCTTRPRRCWVCWRTPASTTSTPTRTKDGRWPRLVQHCSASTAARMDACACTRTTGTTSA